MKSIICIGVFAFLISSGYGYSGGAPVEVCTDMTPQHHVDPQASEFIYTVAANKKSVKSGDKVDITISGGVFKGFLLQVRNGEKAVGSFNVPSDDKFAKTIDCHGSKKSAVTHKNSFEKKSITLSWTAPTNFKGKLALYATVAQDGGVFWVKQKISEIEIK